MEQEGTGTKARDTEDGGDRLGPYRLGRGHELGPGLGCVYEAWNVDTGAVSLVLVPDEQVDWRPSGPWKVKISYDPTTRALMMEVEEAPESADYKDLANILVMLSAAFERLEDDPRIQEHLSLMPLGEQELQTRDTPKPARRERASRKGWFAALAVLGLVVGLFFMHASGHLTLHDQPATVALEGVNTNPLGALAIEYPLPEKPFQGQAVAPCRAESNELEINGGCWIAVARRPPCIQKIQVEHGGHCYVPVADNPNPPL